MLAKERTRPLVGIRVMIKVDWDFKSGYTATLNDPFSAAWESWLPLLAESDRMMSKVTSSYYMQFLGTDAAQYTRIGINNYCDNVTFFICSSRRSIVVQYQGFPWGPFVIDPVHYLINLVISTRILGQANKGKNIYFGSTHAKNNTTRHRDPSHHSSPFLDFHT